MLPGCCFSKELLLKYLYLQRSFTIQNFKTLHWVGSSVTTSQGCHIGMFKDMQLRSSGAEWYLKEWYSEYHTDWLISLL